MKQGYLSEYFDGVAAKRLSAVEVNMLTSHQHEFNGVMALRQLLGEPVGRVPWPAKTAYLNDSDADPTIEDATLTWYDAREKARLERGIKRTEYRLYFPSTRMSQHASEGDLLVIAKRRDGGLLVLVAENNSSISRQMVWLFGLGDMVPAGFTIKSELDTEQDRIQLTSQLLLESIGIKFNLPNDKEIDGLLAKFGEKFPTTREFSAYARSTLKDISAKDNADLALMAWMEREEMLFRVLEHHLIARRLETGFRTGTGTDVDGFIAFSLSVQNRRKSRVGLALENHLETVFRENGILYTRTAVTENRSKPDFLFPSVERYHDPTFPADSLTMLGVKSTCKDRWRQILSEADRIKKKHLLTLETAISIHQTREMQAKHLQLVVPASIHASYTPEQSGWLMNVSDFLLLVRNKQ